MLLSTLTWVICFIKHKYIASILNDQCFQCQEIRYLVSPLTSFENIKASFKLSRCWKIHKVSTFDSERGMGKRKNTRYGIK